MDTFAGIQFKVDTISTKLDGLVDRAKAGQAWLNRVVMARYQRAQIARWKSGGTGEGDANTSEGDYWPKLSPDYYKRKKKKFSSYDYGGNQILVATGALLKKVINPDKIVTPTSLTLRVPIMYAGYVAALRPFMRFSDETKADILNGMRNFIVTGNG